MLCWNECATARLERVILFYLYGKSFIRNQCMTVLIDTNGVCRKYLCVLQKRYCSAQHVCRFFYKSVWKVNKKDKDIVMKLYYVSESKNYIFLKCAGSVQNFLPPMCVNGKLLWMTNGCSVFSDMWHINCTPLRDFKKVELIFSYFKYCYYIGHLGCRFFEQK